LIKIEIGKILRPVHGLEWRTRLRLCTHPGIVAQGEWSLERAFCQPCCEPPPFGPVRQVVSTAVLRDVP
jgi:hypothetical protein